MDTNAHAIPLGAALSPAQDDAEPRGDRHLYLTGFCLERDEDRKLARGGRVGSNSERWKRFAQRFATLKLHYFNITLHTNND